MLRKILRLRVFGGKIAVIAITPATGVGKGVLGESAEYLLL